MYNDWTLAKEIAIIILGVVLAMFLLSLTIVGAINTIVATETNNIEQCYVDCVLDDANEQLCYQVMKQRENKE